MDDTIRALRRRAGVTQSTLADRANTSQPTIAAYEAGRKSPTMDTVRRLAASMNLEPAVAFHPPMTREDRRSLALHEAIADRVVAHPSRSVEKARVNLRRMRDGAARRSPFLREWQVLLDRPVEDLIPVLLDPSPWARELRHVTPFAGILTAAERAAVYQAFSERERRR